MPARLARVCATALVLLLSACAGPGPHHAPPFRDGFASPAPEIRECTRLITAFDDAVAEAGIADGGPRPIRGYPFFRSNRLLSALARLPGREALARREMRELDRRGREVESRNLPCEDAAHLRAEWSGHRGGRPLEEAVEHCAGVLARATGAQDPPLDRAAVPDDYSTPRRVLGAYFLTRIPFAAGVRGYQRETEQMFARPSDELRRAGNRVRYAPQPSSEPWDPAALDLAAGLQPDKFAPLFARFAPVLEVDTTGDDDRIGHPVFGAHGRPGVDVRRPVMFVRVAHTLVRGEIWPQLVYSVWFPARPKRSVFDLLGGNLDGIVWRVTLHPDGTPWLFDTMHSCGCYHQFFPTAYLKPKPSPGGLDEWAFVPRQLTALEANQRIVLTVESGTHYVQSVSVESMESAKSAEKLGEVRRYGFADDESLRTLPAGHCGHRSLYGPEGIVAGTERGERWLFWPMGVAEPGAMRQWGRHATAFVGRRHFDDPDLLERYFEPSQAATPKTAADRM